MEWVGPPTFRMRLDEAPPDQPGILFDNRLRYMGMDVLGDDGLEQTGPFVRHEAESIRLRLWWEVDQNLAVNGDYFVGITMVGPDGKQVTESSSAPKGADGPQQTSSWATNTFYEDERVLTLPDPSNSGIYHLMLSVYDPQTGARVSVTDENSSQVLPIATFTVKSW